MAIRIPEAGRVAIWLPHFACHTTCGVIKGAKHSELLCTHLTFETQRMCADVHALIASMALNFVTERATLKPELAALERQTF